MTTVDKKVKDKQQIVRGSNTTRKCKQTKIVVDRNDFAILLAIIVLMYSFEGDYKRRPVQALGGASKKVT